MLYVTCITCEEKERLVQKKNQKRHTFRAHTIAQAETIAAVHRSEYITHEVIIID